MSQRTGQSETMYTGLRFFGYRIFLEKPKDSVLAAAIKRVFVKDYRKSGPLEMSNPDVKMCLQAKEIDRYWVENNLSNQEIKDGQQALFKER